MPFEDINAVRHSFDCAVNDVVLAVVSGALRRFLALRRAPVADPLVALVPVSTRHGGHPDLGNKVAGMLVSLATAVEDPIERLSAIREQTTAAKRRHQGSGGRLLEDFAEVFPPALTGRLSRWVTAARLFDRVPPLCNLVVSGIPGPGFAIWCAGSQVSQLYLVGPVAMGIGLNVTTVTYAGQLHVSVLGCRRLVPDVQDLAILLDDAREDLVSLATERRRAG
jgi:WS/DGAT/MGAT family acyltransferase